MTTVNNVDGTSDKCCSRWTGILACLLRLPVQRLPVPRGTSRRGCGRVGGGRGIFRLSIYWPFLPLIVLFQVMSLLKTSNFFVLFYYTNVLIGVFSDKKRQLYADALLFAISVTMSFNVLANLFNATSDG